MPFNSKFSVCFLNFFICGFFINTKYSVITLLFIWHIFFSLFIYYFCEVGNLYDLEDSRKYIIIKIKKIKLLWWKPWESLRLLLITYIHSETIKFSYIIFQLLNQPIHDLFWRTNKFFIEISHIKKIKFIYKIIWFSQCASGKSLFNSKERLKLKLF